MDWLVFSLITALLVGIQSIVQKKTLLKEHAMEYSATIAVVILAISLPLFLIVDYSRVQVYPLFILYIGSIFGALGFLLVAKAVRHMDISAASPLLVLGPGITAIFAFIFLGETLSFIQIGGIVLLILGSYVLGLKRHHSLLEPIKVFKKSKFIHYIIFGLVMYGFTATIDRLLLGSYNFQPEAYIAFAHLFLAINYLVLLAVYHDGLKGIKHGLKNSGWTMLAVAVLVAGYRLAQAQAVALAKVALVTSIKRLSVLFAVIVGGELFHEKNLLRKSIACVIMLIGAVIIAL